MATNTLYLNESVRVHFENDFYSIRATTDIPSGTLILVEHVIHGDFQYLMSALFFNPELRDSLYPRDDEKEIGQAIGKKIELNVFKFEDDILVIGDIFSKFNHSCRPNCRMDIVDRINNERFYGIWAQKKIEKGNELFIDYVNGGSVSYHKSMMEVLGATCSCTPDYIIQNVKRSQIMMDLASTYRKNKKDFIETLTDTYLSSTKGLKAIRKNKLAKKEAFRFGVQEV